MLMFVYMKVQAQDLTQFDSTTYRGSVHVTYPITLYQVPRSTYAPN